jgi:uncharacterized integral membrane protein
VSQQQERSTEPVQPAHRGRTAELILGAVLLVAVVALIVANRRTVHVSWVFGSTDQALIWILLATALLGWLLGLVTAFLFRHRRHRRAVAAAERR